MNKFFSWVIDQGHDRGWARDIEERGCNQVERLARKKGVFRAEGGEQLTDVPKVSDVPEYSTLELCSPRPSRRDCPRFSTSTAGQSLMEARFLKGSLNTAHSLNVEMTLLQPASSAG